MAIIATLTGILWMILAPKSVFEARTASISSGLKQAATGLAIYRGDNNDAYPGDWDDFGFTRPNDPKYIAMGANRLIPGPPSYPESWRTEGNFGATNLTYLFNSLVQSFVSQYNMTYPFDDQKYPIFAAYFFQKTVDEHGHDFTFSPPHMSIFTGHGETYKIYNRLGGYADGHVKWGPILDIWQKELSYRRYYGDL
jgi:hypothetical protein